MSVTFGVNVWKLRCDWVRLSLHSRLWNLFWIQISLHFLQLHNPFFLFLKLLLPFMIYFKFSRLRSIFVMIISFLWWTGRESSLCWLKRDLVFIFFYSFRSSHPVSVKTLFQSLGHSLVTKRIRFKIFSFRNFFLNLRKKHFLVIIFIGFARILHIWNLFYLIRAKLQLIESNQ